jgi:hypothetical protein
MKFHEEDPRRKVGRHDPEELLKPTQEGDRTRNFLRGACRVCGRKVSTRCGTCDVYLCLTCRVDDLYEETSSSSSSALIPTQSETDWIKYHTLNNLSCLKCVYYDNIYS